MILTMSHLKIITDSEKDRSSMPLLASGLFDWRGAYAGWAGIRKRGSHPAPALHCK